MSTKNSKLKSSKDPCFQTIHDAQNFVEDSKKITSKHQNFQRHGNICHVEVSKRLGCPELTYCVDLWHSWPMGFIVPCMARWAMVNGPVRLVLHLAHYLAKDTDSGSQTLYLPYTNVNSI